jgi:Ca2+-binding EF-hand superfamily protein
MLRRLTVLALALGIVGFVFGQDNPNNGKKPADPANKGNGKITPEAIVQMILDRMDTNKDGRISREEAQGRIKENFDKIDTNKDGFLDKEELLRMAKAVVANGGGNMGKGPRPGGFAGGPADPYDFDALDKNADGRLTKEELKGTKFYELFEQIDKNKDGKIDPKEWEEFVKKEKDKEKK